MIFKGDLNGDGRITIEDYVMCSEAQKGNLQLTERQFKAADVDGDGKITLSDVVAISDHIWGYSAITETIDE